MEKNLRLEGSNSAIFFNFSRYFSLHFSEIKIFFYYRKSVVVNNGNLYCLCFNMRDL